MTKLFDRSEFLLYLALRNHHVLGWANIVIALNAMRHLGEKLS